MKDLRCHNSSCCEAVGMRLYVLTVCLVWSIFRLRSHGCFLRLRLQLQRWRSSQTNHSRSLKPGAGLLCVLCLSARPQGVPFSYRYFTADVGPLSAFQSLQVWRFSKHNNLLKWSSCKLGLVRLNLKPVSCSGKIIANTHHAFTVVHLQWKSNGFTFMYFPIPYSVVFRKHTIHQIRSNSLNC